MIVPLCSPVVNTLRECWGSFLMRSRFLGFALYARFTLSLKVVVIPRVQLGSHHVTHYVAMLPLCCPLCHPLCHPSLCEWVIWAQSVRLLDQKYLRTICKGQKMFEAFAVRSSNKCWVSWDMICRQVHLQESTFKLFLSCNFQRLLATKLEVLWLYALGWFFGEMLCIFWCCNALILAAFHRKVWAHQQLRASCDFLQPGAYLSVCVADVVMPFFLRNNCCMLPLHKHICKTLPNTMLLVTKCTNMHTCMFVCSYIHACRRRHMLMHINIPYFCAYNPPVH